jgi:hypothetical protein
VVVDEDADVLVASVHGNLEGAAAVLEARYNCINNTSNLP